MTLNKVLKIIKNKGKEKIKGREVLRQEEAARNYGRWIGAKERFEERQQIPTITCFPRRVYASKYELLPRKWMTVADGMRYTV